MLPGTNQGIQAQLTYPCNHADPYQLYTTKHTYNLAYTMFSP